MSEDPIDPADYYFRIGMTFETSDPSVAWLNGVIAAGTGRMGHGGATYTVHQIL